MRVEQRLHAHNADRATPAAGIHCLEGGHIADEAFGDDADVFAAQWHKLQRPPREHVLRQGVPVDRRLVAGNARGDGEVGIEEA